MFLPEHGYIIEKIGSLELTKDQKHQFVECVFRKPARQDEFGESNYPDDIFYVRAWNSKTELVVNLKKGDKVKSQLSLSGREALNQEQTAMYNQLNFSVTKLEKIL